MKINPLTLPELLVSLGPFLSVQDLYSSTQVNRLWNTFLVPFLWYSIDDRLFSWPAILNRIHHDDDEPDTVQVLFEKYGHHIHHLSLSWLTTLQAASAAATCAQLRSLLVFGLKDRDPPPLLTNESEEASSHHHHPTQSSLGPLLAPMFERVFRPSQEVWGNRIKQRQYWTMVQLYWVLVHRNKQHLQNLHLEAAVGRLFRMVSKEYLFDSLALLIELKSIDTGLVQMDLPVLLDQIPSLRTLRSRLNDPFTKEVYFSWPTPLRESFFQLRLLELRDRLYLQEFYHLLRYLPQLDDIVFAGFMMLAGLPPSPQDIMDNKPSQLQGLHLRQIGKQDDRIIPGILQWLPNLKRFGIALLYPSIAKALRTHCPNLESFSDSGEAENGHEQGGGRGGVVVVIPPGVPISSANTLNHLLQHCSKLRTVRAGRHTIMGSYAVKHSWACKRIETLCFRLAGVREDTLTVKRSTTTRTLSRGELRSSGSSSSSNGGDGEVESGLVSRGAQCRELHRRIKERLGELKSLRVIDLGEEWAEATLMVTD
ncbi:hypothetical protein BG015_001782 [Linnemannia schmuckeri]|uniref:F-box domain-containing protein n=1 Tax=Linnemannia schmuckeri TaxID=64567 RepID=A0A9P5RSS1_9FUNG|nr:hypothetical protein BG015_001782 [Linnemannia schmuckeri]